MSAEKKRRYLENTARNMNGVPKEILIHHIRNSLKADKTYGEDVPPLWKYRRVM